MTANSKNVLISIEGRHAEKIVSGEKTVELRRRRMNLSPGDTLWIYRKMPCRRIVATVTVKGLDEGSSSALWDRHKGACGISRREFREYFYGAKVGFAILLGEVTVLSEPVTLDALREREKGFHPPQFGKYLAAGGTLLPFLRRLAAV